MKALRYLALWFAALSAGLSFAHLLEMPPRVFRFDAGLWIGATTGGQYVLFGTVGAVIDVGAVLLAGVLAFRSRHVAAIKRWNLPGAVLFAVALIAWFAVVAPANAQLATWSAETYPSDWTRWRAQWELGHSAIAILKLGGFSLLLAGVSAAIRAAGSVGGAK